MAQTSGFFESVIDETGNYDRVYYANQFAQYFATFISNGVFAEPTNQLKVEALGAGDISVMVRKGMAFINGYWFKLDTNMTVKLSTPSGNYSRWDAIVVRCSMANRTITIEVKEGEYDDNPAKPSITKTDETVELCLAYIFVEKGTVEIYAEDITDTRSDETLCGFVASLVQQLTTGQLFDQYTAIFDKWFNEVKGKMGDDPATSLQEQIYEIEQQALLYYNGFVAKTTVFGDDGSITETSSSGDVKLTTFNDDGSITETLTTTAGMKFTKVTTFNTDGSITETVTEQYNV